MKTFQEINQSETAKRKIKSLAKNSNLDIDFVTLIANYSWDYDTIGREPIGWVQNEQIDSKQLSKDIPKLYEYLEIEKKSDFNKEFLIEQLLSNYQEKKPEELKENFLISGLNKNYCYLSEYSTYHYLNNLSLDNLKLLDCKESYDSLDLIDIIFKKIFRGGAIERYNLFYCYTDLCIKLPYIKTKKSVINDWIDNLITEINNLDESATLKDLIKSCQTITKGDKYFKQEILQSLTYSGNLKVNEIEVSNIFIPEFREVLSSHFYSNEWTYPLRFWNENK